MKLDSVQMGELEALREMIVKAVRTGGGIVNISGSGIQLRGETLIDTFDDGETEIKLDAEDGSWVYLSATHNGVRYSAAVNTDFTDTPERVLDYIERGREIE